MAKYEIKDGVGIIPEGTTKIETYDFSYSLALTSIVIPDSVKEIEDEAFVDCSNLTSIIIGNSVEKIGYHAFKNCSSLTSIVIPASATKLSPRSYTKPNSLFEGCTSLNSIRVAEGNPLYDSRDNCNAIIDTENNELVLGCKTTTIPKSVTKIYCWAYSNEITSIVIPEWITEIHPWAFRWCPKLTSVRVAEGNPVFDSRNDCNAIIESESNTLICGFPMTIIPDSVNSVGKRAFVGCRDMISITIPDKVKEIGDYAFAYCYELKSIIIGKSVKTIGYEAFNNMNDLETITLKGKVKGLVSALDRHSSTSCNKLKTIYVLSKYKSYYERILGWSGNKLIVELPEEKKKK